MGVFRSVVESFVLPMLDAGQNLAFRSRIPLQLVGADHPRNRDQPLEQRGAKNRLAACFLSSFSIAILLSPKLSFY